jgi:Tol biopolymer transport system component
VQCGTASTAGGIPRRLTAAGDTADTVAWSPNGRWLAHAKDAGTGEDILRVPAGGGLRSGSPELVLPRTLDAAWASVINRALANQ